MATTQWTDSDRKQVAQDLGREPRGVVGVAARGTSGSPLVVVTAPRLPNGTPFPTTFYLTSPALVNACSTLEAQHFMAELNARLEEDPDLAAAYARAHQDYLSRRAEIGRDAGLEPVVEIQDFSAGGMPSRVKCLHALVGHALAAGPGVNPIGDLTLEEIQARGMWDGKA